MINRTIAVLDWGIGGLPTYFTLQKRLPGHGIGYFSDSGYPPYGTLGEQELEKRLKTIAQDLIDRGFSSLVVACNAMSTVLFQDKNWGLPTVGIIAPFLKRFEKSLVGATLILGGDRVTSSLIYSNCAHPQSGTTVHRSGQKLSHMIESGIRDSTRIQSAIAQITEDVQEVEQLILACTHYPAYRGFFEAAFPEAMIMDPMGALVDHIQAMLLQSQSSPPPDGLDPGLFLTTGSMAKSQEGALKAFGYGPLNFQPWKLRENT